MRIQPTLALAACLFVASATAHAQLKAPRNAATGMTAPTAAPSAAPSPAPADSNAPAARENADKEAAGTAAAAAWLQMLDRRDWRNAWQASSQAFRSTVPIASWMDGIPKAREPLGALNERMASEAIYKTTLEGRPDGDYVTISFAAKFANKPDAQEIVTTVREADGKWRVMGYQTR